MSLCFCTLAIHAAYRKLARQLAEDLAPTSFLILTDAPGEFADLPVTAEHLTPTGPMAIDYLAGVSPQHQRGQEAYHDKRFVIARALRDYDTALFLDADMRLAARPIVGTFRPGLTILPGEVRSISAHLSIHGSYRRPFFVELARQLGGNDSVLDAALWVPEWCYAVTRDDGRERRFLETWGQAAGFMQANAVFSGEGGVMGLCAAMVGWTVDRMGLSQVAPLIRHEASGPKGS